MRIGSEQEFAGEFAPDIEVKRGGGNDEKRWRVVFLILNSGKI